MAAVVGRVHEDGVIDQAEAVEAVPEPAQALVDALYRSITLPLLAPTTAFVSIIGIISMMQQFALPYIVTNGGPGNSTDLYVFHVFQLSFQGGDLGYASALAFLMLIAVLVLAGVQTRLSKRGMGHEQF